jgi:hypothetical protein
MGACQCIANNSDEIDIKMTVSNNRIHKIKNCLENDEKRKYIITLALTKQNIEDDSFSLNKNNYIALKSERRSKKSNSFKFDWKEHSMNIFEVYNQFRTKPQKFFRKMIKNNLWDEHTAEQFAFINTSNKQLKWSEYAYNILFMRDGVEDTEHINKLLSETFNTKCDSNVLKIDGDYDPEMSVLVLIKKYTTDLESILLSDNYNMGLVICYNDPDRIFFYLFKKF